MRQGNDLRTTVFITLLEALTGFSKTFAHISRQPLTLSRSVVTHDGETEVVKGQGMPTRNVAGTSNPSVDFGDLYVTYKVQYPVKLSDDEKELIRRGLSNVVTWKYESPAVAQ